MNWSRVKTVLIILFLFTDIFLLATYFMLRYSSSSISQEVVDSTVAVLANNDITIDPDIIPKKNPKIYYTEAENIISDYETYAKTFLGDQLSQVDYGYESSRGKITFYGDRFNFVANTDVYALADVIAIHDEKTAKEATVTTLEKLGFDLKNSEISTEKNDSGFSVIVTNNANFLPVFNSEVVVTISNNLITSVSGTWFNEVSSSGAVDGLKSVTAALVDFIPSAPAGTEIIELEPGYSILDYTAYHKTAALIPVWKATAKDGNIYYLDARNL